MSESRREGVHGASLNGLATAELESRLRHLFGEQRRLRALLDQTQAELERINTELFQVQDDYCTDPARTDEYDRTIERILGLDPRISLSEVEEVLAGKRHCDMKSFIEQLEKAVQATSAPGGQ